MKIGPKFKIARRLGSRVFSKTQSTKFSISGSVQKQGGRRPKALSEYGQQLIEKQKARYTYGLKEHQFASYVKGIRGKKGSPVALLYKTLESRLDNVVFRMGIVATRPFARQVITHGHITVNGRRLNIPSYQVKVGDVIAVRKQSQGSGLFKDFAERLKQYHAPAWVIFDEGAKQGTVKASPQYGETEADINFGSILEFYSRV
jgi:small subunit ribosomal protein S4